MAWADAITVLSGQRWPAQHVVIHRGRVSWHGNYASPRTAEQSFTLRHDGKVAPNKGSRSRSGSGGRGREPRPNARSSRTAPMGDCCARPRGLRRVFTGASRSVHLRRRHKHCGECLDSAAVAAVDPFAPASRRQRGLRPSGRQLLACRRLRRECSAWDRTASW